MPRALVVVILLGACGGGGSSDSPAPPAVNPVVPPTPPPVAKPMVVAFGDCADATTAFVSGPRPLPVDDSTPAAPRAAIDHDGHLGKPDPARAEGQYKITKAHDEPRDRAEAMRAATADDRGPSVLEMHRLYGGTGNDLDRMGFGLTTRGYYPRFRFHDSGMGPIGTGKFEPVKPSSNSKPAKPARIPLVSLGTPKFVGDLDAAIIRRGVARALPKIRYCYEKQLLTKPDLAGTLALQFFIDGSGTVVTAGASGVGNDVAPCVASVIKEVQYPKPRGGGGVQVNMPLEMSPSGGTEEPVDPTPKPPATATTTTEPKPRDMYRRPLADVVDTTGYVAGAGNPLHAQVSALTACFAKSAKPYGAAVIELRAGDPAVYGLDAPTTACVAAAAKQIAVAAGAKPQRCPLAYGDMPVGDLLPVDITAGAIAFSGNEVTKTPVARKQLDALTSPLLDTVDELLDKTGPVIAIRGPLNVRIADDAKFHDVVETLAAILGTDTDFVLSTKRGAAWTQLRPMTFPIVPVAYGTGGTWAPIKKRGGAPEPSTRLSVLVTADSAWITGIAEDFIELPRDAKLASALTAELIKKHASPLYANHTDIEIAGDVDVPWREVVVLIDAAVAAGFRDWELTDRDGLTTMAAPLLLAK